MALSGILSKNQNEKIKDYLEKMDGMTIDEIIKGNPLSARRREEIDAYKQLKPILSEKNKTDIL